MIEAQALALVQRILREALGRTNVGAEVHLVYDLGIDSIELLELIDGLEKAMDTELDVEEYFDGTHIGTVGQLAQALESGAISKVEPL